MHRALKLCAAAFAAAVIASVSVLAQKPAGADRPLTPEDRIAILRRSQVWTPTHIASMDIKTGPTGKGAFSPGDTVTCSYSARKLTGKSPKFLCVIGDGDEVKVKYGKNNGEVFGEVASTRLLWALGFGADRYYPVHVICKGCPAKFGGKAGREPGEFVFDVAAIERKAPGEELTSRPDEGWSWRELDLVQEAVGGAPTAHRDALKLLAVMLQHGDSKAEQQRLVCLDKERKKAKTAEAPDATEKPGQPPEDFDEPEPSGAELCLHPFMYVHDVGLTFGRVDALNRNSYAGVNYDRWANIRIWKDDVRCIGNLPKSLSGSLHDPVISEEGRAFLAGLLEQLTDAQLRDLFTVARFTDREPRVPPEANRCVTIDDWVKVFKHKREEISSRRCGDRQDKG